MPPLFLSVGQAGISPLGSFWTLNFNELKHRRKEQLRQKAAPSAISTSPLQRMFYFDRTWNRPRWLMVDSESKVIESFSNLLVSTALRKEGKTAVARHCAKHSVRSHSGMGGCWAKGFHNSGGVKSSSKVKKKRRSNIAVAVASASTTSPPPPPAASTSKPSPLLVKTSWNEGFAKSNDKHSSTSTLIPTALRRLETQLSSSGVQTCTPTFLVSHSLTGGTGSGLTSSLLPSLRDLHPKAKIVAYTISPFLTSHRGISSVTDSTGPLHSYNTILTLVHLRENCDAVIMKANGEVLGDAER